MSGTEPVPMVTAYVGLGSNVGDRLACLRAAVAAMGDLSGTRVIACSAPYLTAPVGTSVPQADFLNAVCRLETGLAADALLARLLDIERAQGRRRDGPPGGPRTLDLDLLLYGDRVLRAPGLQLPHPRLHQRAFVLYPLAEIAPGLSIPGHGPVEALLAACRDQAVERRPVDPALC